MRLGRLFLPIAMLGFVLSGCLGIQTLKKPDYDKVNSWVSQQQFGKALQHLNNARTSHYNTDLESQVNKVQQLAFQYDKDQSRIINQMINEHRLVEARDLLSASLSAYPKGEHLQLTKKRLINIQSTQISRLQAQQLLAKSEWLLKAKKIQKSLLTIKPKAGSNQEELVVSTTELQETAAELYHLGLKALQKGDLDLADSCLTVSNRLYKRNFTTAAIARLNQLQQIERERQQVIENKQQAQKRVIEIRVAKKKKKQLIFKQREFDVLYYKTRRLIEDNQLTAAQDSLIKLNQLLPGDPKLEELNNTFAIKLPTHIKALIKRGKQLYINGKIQKARDIWAKALKLDPDNRPVIENIFRADKVLLRLKELKKNK